MVRKCRVDPLTGPYFTDIAAYLEPQADIAVRQFFDNLCHGGRSAQLDSLRFCIIKQAKQITVSVHLEIPLDLPEEVCYTGENSAAAHRLRLRHDLLTGMDRASLRNMCRICGDGFGCKMYLLMGYTAHGDVADPWYTDKLETTWRDMLVGDRGLLDVYKRQNQREECS